MYYTCNWANIDEESHSCLCVIHVCVIYIYIDNSKFIISNLKFLHSNSILLKIIKSRIRIDVNSNSGIGIDAITVGLILFVF